MRIMKGLLAVSLGMLLFSITSCKKAREDVLIKGSWNLEGIYVDTISTNLMTNFEGWTENSTCCRYRLDFEDNDIVFGYYLLNDSLKYVIPGTWRLIDYDNIYVKVDQYLDGEFEIKKPNPTHFKLESEANHVSIYDGVNNDLDTTYTRIEIERD